MSILLVHPIMPPGRPMAKWDIIKVRGEPVIINAAWPQDRGVFWCTDPHRRAKYPRAFVLDDCAGDAVESMACENGHEGDDERVTCRRATVAEHEEVLARVKAWLEKL